MISSCARLVADYGIPTTPSAGEVARNISSPRIRYLSRLSHAAHVAIQVVLRGGKVAVARKRGGHGNKSGPGADQEEYRATFKIAEPMGSSNR